MESRFVTACGRDCRPQGGMRLPDLTDQLEQIGVGNKVISASTVEAI
jgi:hypothetical protein